MAERYALVRLDENGTPGPAVCQGSAVQVVLAAWEELVPIELMGQLRLHDLPAAQRRKADRLRDAIEAKPAAP